MDTVNFTGKWTEDRSDNKEAFLKKLGLPEAMLKMAVDIKMGLEINHEGDNFTMKEILPDGKEHNVFNFSIGVPFSPKLTEGLPAITDVVVTYIDGGKCLHFVGKVEGNEDYVHDTHLEPNGDLKVVQKCGDVCNTVYYKKQ